MAICFWINQVMYLVILLAGIPLFFMALFSFVVSVLQAATSIQDQLFCFCIKLIVICVMCFMYSSYVGLKISSYLRDTLMNMTTIGTGSMNSL